MPYACCKLLLLPSSLLLLFLPSKQSPIVRQLVQQQQPRATVESRAKGAKQRDKMRVRATMGMEMAC